MAEHSDDQGGSGQTGTGSAESAESDTFLRLNVKLGDGPVVSCDAAAGFKVLELLRAGGVPIKAECGGACVCATCHVRIGGKWIGKLPEPSEEELHKLDEIPDVDERSRLACQIEMTEELDGLEFEIGGDSLDTSRLQAAE